MRKILSIILILTLMCSLFVGCANKVDDESTKEPTVNTETENPSTTDKEENNETKPSEPEKEENKYEKGLSQVKVELLNIESGISFEDMLIDSPYYPADYNHMVSMITVGITYETKDTKSVIGLLSFHGETATSPKDSTQPAYQMYDTSYVTDDGLYEVATYIVYGKVDPAKVTVRINSKDRSIYKDIQFENNGEEKGFANAVEKFAGQEKFSHLPSGIIGINDRYYKVVLSGRTKADAYDLSLSSNQTGYVILMEYKISLLPLEGGRKSTLTGDDITVMAPTNDYKYEYEIANENVFGGNQRLHTSIIVQSQKYYEELPLTENGEIDKEFCRGILSDMLETFEEITISFKNNGETVTVNIKNPE